MFEKENLNGSAMRLHHRDPQCLVRDHNNTNNNPDYYH
jgi:hypothetical protein